MRTGAMIFMVIAASACGRTGLLLYDTSVDDSLVRADVDAADRPQLDATGAVEAAAGHDAPAAPSCGAPDPTSPLVLYDYMPQELGAVAGYDCSFAATWLENPGGPLPLVARTASVVAGAWTLSPPVTVAADVEDNGGIATIGWDGSAYTVAWVNKGTLFLRRMGVDGTLLGPAVESVQTGPDSIPVWINSSLDDGALRMFLLDDRKSRFEYHLYFLRLAPDGTATVPATDLTPDPMSVAFGGATYGGPGDNLLLWVDDSNGGAQPLRLTSFDDEGQPVLPATTVIPPYNGLQAGGLVSGVGETLFGVWEYATPSPPPLVGLLKAGGPGYTAVRGIAGGDAPLLARTPEGTVGVLAGGDGDGVAPSDLHLSFVVDGATTATEVVARGEATSGGYGIAAGAGAFGLYWATGDALKLTVRTP